jgi:hypothetical protein
MVPVKPKTTGGRRGLTVSGTNAARRDPGYKTQTGVGCPNCLSSLWLRRGSCGQHKTGRALAFWAVARHANKMGFDPAQYRKCSRSSDHALSRFADAA